MARLIKICNVNRTKTLVVAEATIESVLKKGSEYYAAIFSHIVLEEDGTRIEGNDVLEECVRQKSTLMLLKNPEEWAAESVIRTPNVEPEKTQPSPLNVSTTENIALQFANFEVDWNKVPDDIMNNLNDTPSETTINRFVEQIAIQLRYISPKIPFKIFQRVSLQITQRIASLRDIDDDGQIVNDGALGFADKLRNHNNYVNRPMQRGRQRRSQIRKGRGCKAGINEEYYKNTKKEPFNLEDVLVMRRFTDQLTNDIIERNSAFIRYKIDTIDSIKDLVEDIPALRCISLLNSHFTLATGIEPVVFNQNFEKKLQRVVNFSKTTKHGVLDLLSTDEEIFTIICKNLKETFTFMYEEVECGLQPNTSKPHPVIIAINNSDTNSSYYIQAEGAIITEKIDTLRDAVKMTLMIYFVYYMKYPRPIAKFLEFIQLFYFKLRLVNTSRSNGRLIAGQQRSVKKLIENIRDSNNDEGIVEEAASVNNVANMDDENNDYPAVDSPSFMNLEFELEQMHQPGSSRDSI